MSEKPKYWTIPQAMMYVRLKYRPKSRQTIYNWMRVGRLQNGQRVYLKSENVAGALVTTKQWVDEFLEGLK